MKQDSTRSSRITVPSAAGLRGVVVVVSLAALCGCAAPGPGGPGPLTPASRTPQQWGTTPAYGSAAINHLAQAAENGDLDAQYLLAVALYKGDGIGRDLSQARNWMAVAARRGYPLAQSDLGFMFETGDGGPQDFDQARRWHETAANQGHPVGIRRLGQLYVRGMGVTRDTVRAEELFHSAAAKGDAQSEMFLGLMYLNGDATPASAQTTDDVSSVVNAPPGTALPNAGPRNFEKALFWLRSAAGKHEPKAQFVLGRLLMDGQAVVPDPRTAYVWLYQAAAHNFPGAAGLRDDCARRLDERDRTSAAAEAEQRLASAPRRQFMRR